MAPASETCAEQRTITVDAVVTATADADAAVIHVGYKIYVPDAETAYATASAISNTIFRALTGSGVSKNDIESSSQFLQHTNVYELQQMRGAPEELAQKQFTVIQK